MATEERRIDGGQTVRDEHGRYAKGTAGGPGRPPRAVETDYLVALSESVSLDDWRAICRRAVTDALDGDAKARDWLTGLLLRGAPTLLDVLAAQTARIDAVKTKALALRSADDFSRALSEF